MPVPEQNNAPEEKEVRASLNRMTASEIFRDSPQLVAFLRFVVEAELRGESERIKGYTIGVEALGRSEEFDPQLDPIVRVEATRLRRTIDRYYAGPGANDPVTITLSPGSYVPSFRRRETKAPRVTAASLPKLNRRIAFIAAAAGMSIAALATIAILLRGDRVTPGTPEPGNGMPFVLLQPFTIAGKTDAAAPSPDALIEKLRDAFSRFDTINVALYPAPAEIAGRVRFRLASTIEHREDGTANLRFQLFDAADGTQVWARVFERFAATGDRTGAEDVVVTQITTLLVQPFGVIRAHERNRHLTSRQGDPRYRCILEASESLRSFDPAQHNRARQCLEALISADPSFASGFAYLAALYLRQHQFDVGGVTESAALDRALLLARQAIEKQPESSRGYQMLSAVLFGRGEVGPAFAAIEKAIALNKYDMTVLSDYGGRLVMSGEVHHGLVHLQRAGAFGIIRPSWYNFYFFLGHYLKGDIKTASHYASQITPEGYPLGHVAQALAAHAAGDVERTRRAIAQLTALRGGWRNQTREELRKLIPSEAIVERLASDLAAAGLVSGP
jgi:tetratricopeptide (TPR) repeat protein